MIGHYLAFSLCAQQRGKNSFLDAASYLILLRAAEQKVISVKFLIC